MIYHEYYWEAIMAKISLPIYVIFIGLEIILSHVLKIKLYSIKDFSINIFLTICNMSLDVFVRILFLGSMTWIAHFEFIKIDKPLWYWLILLLLVDFAYWFLHWLGHRIRLFWAVHVTHHSSIYFNISVGFRSSLFEPLYRFLFFLPLGLFGFNAADIMLVFSIQQLYGSLIHTKLIDKMGFLEYILITPSHHRVHHASNTRYLDKNMGMIFVFWDKIFKTFEAEDKHYPKIEFGLTKNLENQNPLNIIFHEFRQMIYDVNHAPGIKNKLMYIFGPPGWSHDGSRQTSKQLQKLEKENGN